MSRKSKREAIEVDDGEARNADTLIEKILAGLPKLTAGRDENGETDDAPGELARRAVDRFREGVRKTAKST